MKIKFTSKISDLKWAFEKTLKMTGGLKSNKIAQIRVYYDSVEFIAKGTVLKTKAESDLEGDILCPSRLLKSYINSCTSTVITFTFSSGSVQCGSSIFETNAIEVFRHGFIANADIPINANLKTIQNSALQEIDSDDFKKKG
jgi:hypothetical protein